MVFSGCIKKYKYTTKVCERTLFVETFNVHPAGVDADYITDSVNFRMYTGKWDNEHENFRYSCSGDSLIIQKIAEVDTSFVRQVIDTKVFSIKELKSKGMFE
jgi:hypothetical protein